MKRHALLLLLFLLLLVALAVLGGIIAPETASAQSAMCRQALASPEGRHLIVALRRGIIVLLAAPFLLFGVVAYCAVRAHRRSGHRPSESA